MGLNAVVQVNRPMFGVVVAYDDTVSSNRYSVILTDTIGRHPHGPAIKMDSTEIEDTGLISRKPGRIYRKNLQLGLEQRGCSCMCCEHMDEGYAED